MNRRGIERFAWKELLIGIFSPLDFGLGSLF